MKLNLLKYRKIYFILFGIIILGSLTSLFYFGLQPGIEFTGGSILEIEFLEARLSNQVIRESLTNFDLGTLSIQPSNEKGVILRMKEINEPTHQELLKKLESIGKVEEKRFEAIGPLIGQELKEKTKWAIGLALICIVLYVAFAFRKVQRPIKSWYYGLATLFSLSFDILIPVGILAILGKFYGVQITIPIIAALLTILGYSVNNVVVVFDRIRENLLRGMGEIFEGTVEISLSQTLSRCVNTTLTTIFPLLAIFFIGGETLKYFSLTLILGIMAGFFSSLFLASPTLVSLLRLRRVGPR